MKFRYCENATEFEKRCHFGIFFSKFCDLLRTVLQNTKTLISYTYLIIKRNLVPFLWNKSKAILRFLFELKVHSFMSEKFMRLKNIFQITILSRKFKLVVSCSGREIQIFWSGSWFWIFFEPHQTFWPLVFINSMFLINHR